LADVAVVVITSFTFLSATTATFVSPPELTVGMVVVSVLVIVVVVDDLLFSNAIFVAYAVP
jgi:hypothetical protein